MTDRVWGSSVTEGGVAQAVCLGSFLVDARGIVLGFDVKMEELTGWPAVEVVGRHKDLAGAHDLSNGYPTVSLQPLYEGSLACGADPFDLRIRCRDGSLLDVEASAKELGGPGGRIAVSVSHLLARSEAPSRAGLADHRDRLTGLADRAAFMARLKREIASAPATAKLVTLLLVDVDHLRRINDRLGRSAGDEVLRKLAGALRAVVGNEDCVARLADDDFGIMLVGSGRGDARQIASRLRSNMQQLRFLCGRVGSASVRATLSMGSASFPADAESEIDLIERARDALSQARALGRNRVWCYVRRRRVEVKTPVYFDSTEPLILGFTRDLSPSGMFVQTPVPLQTGMRCALSFPLPGTEENVHVIGRVVRTVPPGPPREEPAEQGPGMGIEFEKFGSEDRRTIESYLHSIKI